LYSSVLNQRALFDVVWMSGSSVSRFHIRYHAVMMSPPRSTMPKIAVFLEWPCRGGPCLAVLLAADVGFVDFDRTGQAVVAVHLTHELADLMAHAPCGLVGHA
jgi:hypothetical protein